MIRYIVERGGAGWYVKEPSPLGPGIPPHVVALCIYEADAKLIAEALEAFTKARSEHRKRKRVIRG